MKKIILMFLLFVSTLFANIGKITLLEGEAFVKRGEETLRLNISDSISNNDFIETKTNSKVKITFIDNTIITIGKESSLKIEDYFFDSNNKNSAKSELSVSKGAFHAITGQIGKVNPEKFKLKTKNATIGIRGTEIYGDQNRVFCTQGAIFVNSFGETREVSQGFFVNTFDNQIPSQSTPIDQQQFQDVNSRLNTNSLGNNQNPNNFDNPSSPLAFQNSPNPQMNQNQDNQNSWGYWAASNIQDDKNIAQISKKLNSDEEPTPNPTPNPTPPIESVVRLTYDATFTGANVYDPGKLQLNFLIGGSTNKAEAFMQVGLIDMDGGHLYRTDYLTGTITGNSFVLSYAFYNNKQRLEGSISGNNVSGTYNEEYEDGITMRYFQADFDGRKNIDNLTDYPYVQGLIDNASTTNLSFAGAIDVNAIVPTTSSITLNFDFGGGVASVSGEYQYNSTNFDSNGSFSGQAISTGFLAAGDHSSLIGNFHGNNINSVSGSIQMDDFRGRNISQKGTFNATR
ncbi:FecR family protein [Aliarcobacter cryaerophilus]|uniref:FecR family protein n=1 Tax=Aliarcobacter cryaerophilus TaxID=28198 RepID=UPI0021B3BFAB|nr:FecR family protein [Aliarcobacter cryaerophilus]MCT7521435.1 FecR family protein [Aliarcobacter cryaerophilus]